MLTPSGADPTMLEMIRVDLKLESINAYDEIDGDEKFTHLVFIDSAMKSHNIKFDRMDHNEEDVMVKLIKKELK